MANDHNEELKPPIVSPNPLNFGTLPQGSNFTQLELIHNPNEQTLLLCADKDETWLTLHPGAGNLDGGGQQPVNVTADTSSLAVGDHEANLTFAWVGDDYSVSTQVPVKLAISPVSPLAVGLSFALSANSSQTLPLAITNRYGQTLHWKAASSENWLALDRNEGDLKPHEQQTIWVTAKAGQLVSKDYPANLSFTLEILGTRLTSVKFPVELHVLPPNITAFGDDGPKAPIGTPTGLDFVVGGKNPLPLQIINQEDRGKVNWTINAGGANWLNFDIDGGSFQNVGDMVTVNVRVVENLPAPGASTDLHVIVAFADPPWSSREPTVKLVPTTLTVP